MLDIRPLLWLIAGAAIGSLLTLAGIEFIKRFKPKPIKHPKPEPLPPDATY
jgi:hypothetical protein